MVHRQIASHTVEVGAGIVRQRNTGGVGANPGLLHHVLRHRRRAGPAADELPEFLVVGLHGLGQ